MSCISVNVALASEPLRVNVTPIGSPLEVDISCLNWFVRVEDVSPKANVKVILLTKPLQVRVATICGVNSDVVLRFDYDKLTWLDDDNREGVIKYNILTASSDWSLEEVIIEELL